jgi:hypothetical protein
MHRPFSGTCTSTTLGSFMNKTVAAWRMASASTIATRSSSPSPAMRFCTLPEVSVGRAGLVRDLGVSARVVAAPSPPPLSLDPTVEMKSSSVRLTLLMTLSRRLIRASSASSIAHRMALRSSCSAAIRLCAPRNAR